MERDRLDMSGSIRPQETFEPWPGNFGGMDRARCVRQLVWLRILQTTVWECHGSDGFGLFIHLPLSPMGSTCRSDWHTLPEGEDFTNRVFWGREGNTYIFFGGGYQNPHPLSYWQCSPCHVKVTWVIRWLIDENIMNKIKIIVCLYSLVWTEVVVVSVIFLQAFEMS